MRSLSLLLLALFSLNVFGAQAPAPQPLPEGDGTALVQLVIALLVVLGAIFFMAWLLRRLNVGQVGGGRHLRILGALSVGTRERVVLLQVGEEQILVGVAAGSVRKIHALSQPVGAESPTSGDASPGFAARLAAAIKERKTS